MSSYTERFLEATSSIDLDSILDQTVTFVTHHLYLTGHSVYCTNKLLKEKYGKVNEVAEVLYTLQSKGYQVMHNLKGSMATKYDKNGDPSTMLIIHRGKLEYCVITSDTHEIPEDLNNVLQNIENKDIAMRHYYYCSNYVNDDAVSIPYDYKNTWHKEFYPWMDYSMQEYVERFESNRSNIVFLYGAPGTGKTNWLKHFLITKGMKAAVCSDARALKTGDVFSMYGRSEAKTLVLEDADTIVGKREDNNDIMSLILNFTDGVLSSSKKIIISTNLTNLNKVDAALIRPGRCFKVLHFTKLTPEQANAARASLGLPYYEFEDSATLADALHAGNGAIEDRGFAGFI